MAVVRTEIILEHGGNEQVQRMGDEDGRNIIFVCNTDWKSGRYDISGDRTLKEVDLIAAEDTRNSIKLLNHFEIQTPMTSYHEYNKYDKGQ